MPCYKPLQGWRSRSKNESGKRSITFRVSEGYRDMPVEVPCGRCVGCRLERSRQWAMRLMHEKQMHQDSCFITLTYDDEHVPFGGTLEPEHFTRFIKRLRKRFPPKSIRYFHCGEYGDESKRPHYHAILFGVDFTLTHVLPGIEPSNVVEPLSGGSDPVYYSSLLSQLWSEGGKCLGLASVGKVTFESCAYVSRYILKKVSVSDFDGQDEERYEMYRDHYKESVVDSSSGEVFEINRVPEYITMSLKPAIGSTWFDKFKDDVYPRDEVIMRGRAMMSPKAYMLKLEKFDKDLHSVIRGERVKRAKANSGNSTPSRLRVRERVKLAQISSLKRSI